MSGRTIMHVDMDAFFAAVELLRHPEHEGKPLVVGGKGEPQSRGVVSAASYEARKFGIRSGMPLVLAYRKCPDAIFLPVDFKHYVEVSRQFKKILRSFTPVVESFGLDEASLDVTKIDQDPETLGRKVKEQIKQRLNLTASVGIAPNKLLAKIASAMHKPDGLTIVKKSEAQAFLAPLPVRTLLGVGPKTEARLKKLNITRIGQLALVSLDTLTDTFGAAYGTMLHNFARGRDTSPVTPRRAAKSFGRETTFEIDTENLGQIKAVLLRFARFLFTQLKRHHVKAKTVTVKIRFADFTTFTRSHTVPDHITTVAAIFNEAQHLLEQFPSDKKIRLVGLRLSNLEKSD